jgi:AraC-like DNA-binding protein
MKSDRQREEWIGSKGQFLVERHIADTMAAAHWHDHVEVNLLLDGRMTYLFNGRQEQVEAGRLVLFWAAIPHQTIMVTADAPLICIYLPLADFLALPITRQARQAIMQGKFLTEDDRSTADPIAVSQWERDWRSGNPDRQRLVADEVKLRIRRLVLDHAETRRSDHPASPAPPAGQAVRHVELITNLINDHYAHPLSMPYLAQLAGVHVSTANKAFREVLGMSVNEYLVRYRITRAIQLLSDTDESVLQIGFVCGFGSSSRFYDLFKKRTGKTPLHFRRSAGSKSQDQYEG